MGGSSGKVPYLLVGKRRSRTEHDLRVVAFGILAVEVEAAVF